MRGCGFEPSPGADRTFPHCLWMFCFLYAQSTMMVMWGVGGGGDFFRPQHRCWPCWDAHPGICTPTLILHCSPAPGGRHQIISGMPSGGDPALLPGHLGGVLIQHLQCPPLTTILVINSIESRPLLCPSTNPLVDSWRLWPELPMARKEAGTPRQVTTRAWHENGATEAEIVFFFFFLYSYTWG